MQGQQDLVLMQGRPEKFPAAHAHDCFLVWPIFTQDMKQRPQAKVSACSPIMPAGLAPIKVQQSQPQPEKVPSHIRKELLPYEEATAGVALVQLLQYQYEALPTGGLSKACCLKSLAVNPLPPACNDETGLEVGARSACCTMVGDRGVQS